MIFKQMSLVIVRECIFTNRVLNYATLYLTGNLWRNYTGFSASGLAASAPSNMLGSTVLGISSNSRSQIGISLAQTITGATPITIGANVAQASYVNVFDNLPVGISANAAKVNVIKNLFQNINGQAGYDSQAANSAGIYSAGSRVLVGTITGTVGSVASNTFVNNGYGVRATTISSLEIGANYFTTSSVGIFITKMWGNASYTFLNRIVNNSFFNVEIDINGFDNQKMIMVIMSNTSNYTGAATKSNQSFNIALAELTQNPQCQYKVESNLLTGKFTYGVYAGQLYAASISNNTITMKPPFGARNMADIWIENSSELSVKFNYLNVNPTASQVWNTFGIHTSASTNNLYCSNDIKRSGVSMKFNGTSPSHIYANRLNNNPSDPNRVGLMLDASGNVGNINIPIGGGSMACAENEFGDFVFADTYVNNGYGTQIDYDGLNAPSNPFCPFLNLSSNLTNQPFVSTSNTYAGFVNCGSVSNKPVESGKDIVPTDNNYKGINVVEQNQKAFNVVYHTYLKGLTMVSAGQWNSLKVLAAKCPFTDGNSVYQARTLLFNTGDTTDYTNACEVFTPPTVANSRIKASITASEGSSPLETAVYPNPAKNELTVVTGVKGSSITITNLLGQVVLSSDLENLTTLDVSNLKNGTYLYTITKDKTIIKSDKLIITK
jgi:hypothetical protein